ncbi:MAG: DUF835 domain-containing protein [Methanomassiliicoccaceae archaeon]|nr:DUF835 domain-containing protein [Methanomassiliicoccaceae archaeon]
MRIVNSTEADPEGPKASSAKDGVTFGSSYVMFQSGPDAVNDLISRFGNEGYDVLVVTAGKKKTVKKRFGRSNVEALTMKIRFFGGHFNIYGLGTMIDSVMDFIAKNERPVVAFDDLSKIIERNGMNSTLAAVHQLITEKYDKDKSFLVSADPEGFTDKDKKILLNHMAYHDPIGE